MGWDHQPEPRLRCSAQSAHPRERIEERHSDEIVCWPCPVGRRGEDLNHVGGMRDDDGAVGLACVGIEDDGGGGGYVMNVMNVSGGHGSCCDGTGPSRGP